MLLFCLGTVCITKETFDVSIFLTIHIVRSDVHLELFFRDLTRETTMSSMNSWQDCPPLRRPNMASTTLRGITSSTRVEAVGLRVRMMGRTSTVSSLLWRCWASVHQSRKSSLESWLLYYIWGISTCVLNRWELYNELILKGMTNVSYVE